MALPTLLLTRPEASAHAFVAKLDRAALAAVDLVFAPLMEIVETPNRAVLPEDAAAVFSSQNGVRFAPEGQDRAAYCVGAQTTRAAMARGWTAQHAGNTAKELIASLIASPSRVRLFHLGGKHTIGDIAGTLCAAGIPTEHIALYTQRLLPLSASARDALSGPCILPVFSPRSAVQLARQAQGRLGKSHIIALSEAVAAPLSGESTASCLTLPAPDADYMRKEVENLCLTLGLA